jgi:hypothetical protein
MNNKQQTSVEWLETQIQDLIPNDIGSQLKFKNKIKQAKEMEKERIINANRDGVDMVVDKKDFISGEQYYEQTYGGGQQ